MMFHKWLIILTIGLVASMSANSQSVDERIANAMNASDWFGLDSIYESTPKDSINPFLEVFSRCLIGNRLNRPDVSIPAFEELFNNYNESLDLNNYLSSSVMWAMDLSRVGKNKEAASLMSQVIEQSLQYLDSAAVMTMRSYESKYRELSAYQPYAMSIDGDEGVIPFKLIQVGRTEKPGLAIELERCQVNGHDIKPTFDTGAGVNIVNDSIARLCGLIYQESDVNVMGVGRKSARLAIAKELVLGNVTLTDVPFYVVDMSTGNREADNYVSHLELIVGSELMLAIKDLTVDFIKRSISIPREAAVRSDEQSNMCFSSQMNLLVKGGVDGRPLLFNLDTGDASTGILMPSFYKRNKDYVLSHSVPDTIRQAGLGGWIKIEGFNLENPLIKLGNSQVRGQSIFVCGDNSSIPMFADDVDCNLGLQSIILFDRIRFNMVDMTLTAMPVKKSDELNLNASKIKYNHKPEYTDWQAVGMLLFGVTKQLIYPYSVDNPDL